MNGRLAVGTARLAKGVANHESALRTALCGGIQVVDTAASFGGGAAECLVGDVLKSVPPKIREGVEVVSKFGFHVAERSDNPADVRVEHSLDPAFMRTELEATRRRLSFSPGGGGGGGRPLEAFLVDSPERFLQSAVERRNKALGELAEAAAVAAEAASGESLASVGAGAGGGGGGGSGASQPPANPFLPDEFQQPPRQSASANPASSSSSSSSSSSAATAAARQAEARMELAAAEAGLVSGKLELLEALGVAFEALEAQVAKGAIRSYGVASDSLALDGDDPLFLDWREVEALAEHAHSTARTTATARTTPHGNPTSTHGLRVLQLPLNVLEPKGAEVARAVATANHLRFLDHQASGGSSGSESSGQGLPLLRVMATRPLTAIVPLQLSPQQQSASTAAASAAAGGSNSGGSDSTSLHLSNAFATTTWQRLVEFDPQADGPFGDPLAPAPGGYMAACQAAVEHFNFPLPTDRNPTEDEEELHEACRWLRQLISDLNQSLIHFASVAQYEAELANSIMPLLDAKMEELDQGSAHVLTAFFAHYHGMVRFHACSTAKAKVLEALQGQSSLEQQLGKAARSAHDESNERLEAVALRWALRQGGGVPAGGGSGGGSDFVGFGGYDVVVGLTHPSHAAAALFLLQK